MSLFSSGRRFRRAPLQRLHLEVQLRLLAGCRVLVDDAALDILVNDRKALRKHGHGDGIVTLVYGLTDLTAFGMQQSAAHQGGSSRVQAATLRGR